jgi:chromosome segregation ATPase
VTEVQQLEANLPALKERLSHVVRESSSAREAAADKEKRLGSGLRELQREVDKLEEQTKALRQYEASNSSDQLNGLRQRTGELEAKLAAELESLDALQTELQDKEAAVKSRESYKVRALLSRRMDCYLRLLPCCVRNGLVAVAQNGVAYDGNSGRQ